MQPGSPDAPDLETDNIPGYIPVLDANETSTKKNPYHDKMNVKGAINHSDEDFQTKKQAQISACSSSTMDSFIQDVPYVPSPIAVQYDPNTDDIETTTQDPVDQARRNRRKLCACCASSCSFFSLVFFLIIIVAFTFAFVAL